MQALSGIRVLELSQMWAAPGAAMYLADHGADVIKVEPPWGDEGRRAFTQRPVAGNESRAFLALNRNKRAIALDIRHPGGREIIHRIIRGVDVVIHNLRPGVAERLGYDYPTLKVLNERLVYAWLTAYGPEGPYVGRPGYDLIFQALSGILARRRLPDGTPLGAGVWVADCSVPMELAYGIALALLMRERTGEGQLVTTSLLHAALAMQLVDLVEVEHEAEGFTGDVDYTAQAMYAPYRCGDGRYLIIVVVQDEEWRSLCQVLELLELADDPRYRTALDRAQASDHLRALLAAAFERRARDEWLKALVDQDVPSAPIVEPEDVFDGPQVVANEMLVETPHPVAGRTRMVGQPVRLHSAVVDAPRPAPRIGEHTEEVLLEFGYSSAAIQDLEQAGLIKRLATHR